ncbi:slr1601 family putative cell division protein [Calothrix sp. 336/3]|uniref:slr1601 family putative cell division protein n=1 Tax=Calothrix sp. 336/3 TaxID=1337936 RepID=UPI0004E3C06E|nr:hypothetical protein [Calothrix sp. 336/3]AKG21109.1 hypothetical protein IJ00_07185 [Calothrix sp. 336/3]
MNAIQPSRTPLEPIQQRRVSPRPKRHLRQRSHQIMALESTVKIGVNLAISAVAVSALVQLLPNHWSLQEKLREIRSEVKQMEQRVNGSQAEFSQNFDPHQAQSVMQQQGYRFDPNQRQVVIINKEAAEVQQAQTTP